MKAPPLPTGPRAEFDWKRRPSAGVSLLCTVLVVCGCLLLAVPLVAPPVHRAHQRQAMGEALAKYELTDALNTGLFHRHPLSTDTLPNTEAAFYGIMAAKDFGITPFKKTDYLLKEAVKHINSEASAEDLHHWSAIVQALGGKPSEDLSKYVLSLVVNGAGFASSHTSSLPSLFASYHAMEALEISGEKAAPEVVVGVEMLLLECQDTVSGGFAPEPAGVPTMAATWAAVKTLLKCNMSEVNVVKGLSLATRFLAMTRAADGGFHEFPTMLIPRAANVPSPASATARGLQIADLLSRSVGASFSKRVISTAYKYLAAAVTCHGIVEFPGSHDSDIEAAFHVAELGVDKVPHGYPRRVIAVAQQLALALFTLAVSLWFKKQFSPEIFAQTARLVAKVFVVLAVPAAVLGFFPVAALPVYLVSASYLVYTYYRLQESDTDGSMNTVASFISLVFLGLVIGLQLSAPVVFMQQSAYVIITAWSFVAAVLVTYFAAYLVGCKDAKFWCSAAVLAWAINLISTVILLFSRDVSSTYRVLSFRREREAVLVLYPVISLVLNVLGAGLGFCLYAGPAGGKLPAIKKLLSYFGAKPKRN